VIIAISGSRSITSRALIAEILDTELAALYCSGATPALFRLGDAIGVDHAALLWARERELPRRIYFADRNGYAAWALSAQLFGARGVPGDPGGMESAYLSSHWDDPRFGDRAGAVRNSDMIRGTWEELDADGAQRRADLLIAIWDGASPGTRLAMAEARNAGVPVHQWGGDGPVEFRTPMERDAEIVTWQGALPDTPAPA
jgi:hypothetical protein